MTDAEAAIALTSPANSKEAERKQTIQAQAQELFQQSKKLIFSDPESAVEGLKSALKLYVSVDLGTSPVAAPVYLAYGMALVEAARAGSDVFGEGMNAQTATKEKLMGTSGAGTSGSGAAKEETKAAAAPSGSASEKAASETEAAGAVTEGKPEDRAKGAEAKEKDGEKEGEGAGVAEEDNKENAAEGDEEEEGDGEEEDEEADNEEEQDDSALAWDMLEMARTLFLEDGASKHLLSLSDVHTTLSDLKMEEGAFALATEELRKALSYAEQMTENNYRIEAEIHYKLTLALHYNEEIDLALQHSVLAVDKMKCARKALEDSLEGLDEKIQAGDKEAAAVLEKGERELESIDEAMQALVDKKEDLEMVVKENAQIKAQIAAMFCSALGSAPAGSAAAKAAQAAMAAGGLKGAKALIAGAAGLAAAASGSGEGSSSGSGLGAAAKAGAPVQDLGVVGRGRGRITLQPSAAAPSAQPAAAAAPQQGGKEQLSEGATAAVAPKRTLETLMGGVEQGLGSGPAAGGFGAGAAGAVDMRQELLAKRMKAAEKKD